MKAEKRWVLTPQNPQLLEQLSQELSLSPLLIQILLNRGLKTAEQIQNFLNPSLSKLADPFLMKDMSKAVQHLDEALQQKLKITVYGDYDVDGTTGATLLYEFLKSLGAQVDVYIPHRVQEGYGLNFKALQFLKEKGTDLVVTVDNGISSVEEAKQAQELGLKLIIIDHHQVPPQIPMAMAVLNPKQIDCAYPYKELSGVGVAFQLAMALRAHLRKSGFFEKLPEPNLKSYLALVALGTIADVVPLTGQNRILVKAGLIELSQSQKPGIVALKEVAQVKGEVSPGQVGFRLAPRLNAVGRLESAKLGFDLLTTSNVEEANLLAKRLDAANSERQKIEEQILEEAIQKVEQEILPAGRKVIVVFEPHWHIGVVGIVASRLVERFSLPALVGTLEGDRLRFSARSIYSLDLYEALKACQQHLLKFGGHHYAAGLSLGLEHKDEFENVLDAYIKQHLSDEDFQPRLKLDLEVQESQLGLELMDELSVLEPYGAGNPEPTFLIKDLELLNVNHLQEKHLKMQSQGQHKKFDCIGFSMKSTLQAGMRANLAFQPQINEWNGLTKLQLRLCDLPRKADFSG